MHNKQTLQSTSAAKDQDAAIRDSSQLATIDQSGLQVVFGITNVNVNEDTRTISTASSSETHSIGHTKHLKSEQEIKFEQQQRQETSSEPSTFSSTSQHSVVHISTSTSVTKQKFRALCKLADWISFQDNIVDVQYRKGRRLHGLQLPFHPLQLFGWLVLILFGITTYSVLIPSFSTTLQGPFYGLITGLYVVHIVSHLTALLTDPADKELRKIHRNDRIVPEFDRTKHTHVIENGRCHLCNIGTSSTRTKHCSVCNKCVGKFDHHCKWLNHCIGSRNYVAFLMCVVSAVIATLVIVAAVVAQIVLYYLQPTWLNCYWCSGATQVCKNSEKSTAVLNGSEFVNFTLVVTNGSMFLNDNETADIETENNTLPGFFNNITTLLTEESQLLRNLTIETATLNASTTAPTTLGNSTATILNGISLNDTIFLILIGILGLLAAITAGLLLHLCFFHIYISFLGLTTYEYIRNHRQVQDANEKKEQNIKPNAASHPTTMLSKNGKVHFSPSPSKKSNIDSGQVFCCSSSRHPNEPTCHNQTYLKASPHLSSLTHSEDEEEESNQLRFHCCVNSHEFHQQRATKTYYMCSLLEEHSASPIALAGLSQLSGIGPYENIDSPISDEGDAFKTFHCFSSFAAKTNQRRVSGVRTKSTLMSDLDAATATLNAHRSHSYLQYAEQCTFCTFRIRSPLASKRPNASRSRTKICNQTPNSFDTIKGTNKRCTTSVGSPTNASSTDAVHCCMKSITKSQRWRRKWSCCTNVPESPDVPSDKIAALAFGSNHNTTIASGATAKINAVQLRSTSNHTDQVKTQESRERNTRTWPVVRFRHMIRMLSRYRRPVCRHSHNTTGIVVSDKVKQNQIRPLQLQSQANGCRYHRSSHYYDSSSPIPLSSTTTKTPISELSSEANIYSDSREVTTPVGSTNTIETILPTSVIRDDSCMTYQTNSHLGSALPPALPPPTRRKIPYPTNLDELAETLSFAVYPSKSSCFTATNQRLPAINNIYRRQRRKHLRTRSPTLSPIHESGLSNPTSPQPYRHNNNSQNGSNCTAAEMSSTAVVMNSICSGLNDTIRKAPSNSSLCSISVNSSSN